MSPKFNKLVLVTLAAVGLTVAAAGPAAASTNADQRLDAALAHVAGNTATSQDIAVIRQHPDVARRTPDPAGLRLVSTTTTAVRPRGLVGPAALSNYYTENVYAQLSTIGNVLYNWHLHVGFSADPPRGLMGWTERYDWISEAASVVNFREIVRDAATGTPATWGKVTFQRRIEYCVTSYCYANTYPHADVTVDGTNLKITWLGAAS